jgi:hypothetical protein
VEVVRAGLLDVEWTPDYGDSVDRARRCPSCDAEKPGPHLDGCEIKAALVALAVVEESMLTPRAPAPHAHGTGATGSHCHYPVCRSGHGCPAPDATPAPTDDFDESSQELDFIMQR